MSYDTIIEGTILYQGQIQNGCIGIRDGKIAKVKKVIEGYERHDFGSKVIIPAAIDAHVHFREPGATQKEDFQSGSLAALHGGVATVFDMPNNTPFISSRSRLLEKKELVSKRALVNFGLYASPGGPTEVDDLIQEGAAFKFFLAESTSMAPNMPNLEDVYRMLYAINGRAPVAFHAEDGKVMAEQKEKYQKKGYKKEPLEEHYYLRPPEAEASAVQWVISVYDKMRKEKRDTRFHLCHISSRQALAALLSHENAAAPASEPDPGVVNEEQAKEQEQKPYHPGWHQKDYSSESLLTFETAPHYIFLDKVVNAELGVFGKVNPSLKRDKDNAALWQALSMGQIDFLASDHAPHLPHEKENEELSGLPGVETMAPLFLKLVREDRLGLGAFVELFSHRPAQVFKLNKGKLEEGMDADLMVVDFHELTNVKGDELFSRCGWSPYEGREVIFPYATFVGGKLMMKDGAVFGEKGDGKFVRSS